MTNTFEVGDKVTVLDQHQVTITYGPFMSTFNSHEAYVAADSDGRERSYRTTDLKARPAFAVGDKVIGIVSGQTYTIRGGPFRGTVEPWYATEDDSSGLVHRNTEGAFKSAPADEPVKVDEPIKVGDRVRITEAGNCGANVSVGDVFTVRRTSATQVVVFPGSGLDGAWYLDAVAVEKVTDAPPTPGTYYHAGTGYDLAAKYRDRDGDEWEFTGDKFHDGSPVMYHHGSGLDDLGEVLDTYGPLTRV